MKTFKILFAAIIIAGFATSAMAQTTDNDTATASAVILTEMSVENAEDINFGSILADAANPLTPNLNPVTGAATGGAGSFSSDTSIGKFVITTGGQANVKFSWVSNDLDGPGPDLGFTPSVSFGLTDGDNGGTIIDNDDVEEIEAAGIGYIWVGGTISVAAGQAPGSYTGDFTLTAEYN